VTGIIVFKSTAGSTLKYAEIIGGETNFEMYEAKRLDLHPEVLDQADMVLIGTPIHAGKLDLAEWIKKNFPRMSKKKVLLYTVSLTPPDSPKIMAYLKAGLPDEIIKAIKFIPLRGRMRFSAIPFFKRIMVKMAINTIKDPAKKAMMLDETDHIKDENIKPIVDWVAEQSK